MDTSEEKFEVRPIEQYGDFMDKVSKAAEVSYKEVAKNLEMDPNLVYSSRRCEQVSEILKGELDKEGVESKIAKYVGWDITSHEMVVSHYSGEEIIIDPTWQQFLDKPNPSLPRVLIAKREEIEKKLVEFGVPQDKYHVWKDALVRSVGTPSEQ